MIPEVLTENMTRWPTDLHDPLSLFYAQSNKTYLAGYCYLNMHRDKSGNRLGPNQSMSGTQEDGIDCGGEWAKWWCELAGECLWMWKIDDDIAALTFKPEPMLAQIMSVELEPTVDSISLIKSKSPRIIVNISDAVVDVLPFPFTSISAVF